MNNSKKIPDSTLSTHEQRKKSWSGEFKFQQQNFEFQTPLPKENSTGLPYHLKLVIEKLSGYSLSDISVHYNSAKPAQIQAHAYAQGKNIYIAPGQEKYLAHEVWHVVQQKQGRVKPTMYIKSVAINNDEKLEKEAEIMGEIAEQICNTNSTVNINKYPITTIYSPYRLEQLSYQYFQSKRSNYNELTNSAEKNEQQVIQRAVIKAAVSGLDRDLNTIERVEFAQLIKQVIIPVKLENIRTKIEDEQAIEEIDPVTRTANIYALSFIRDQLELIATSHLVPDESIKIAKKAPLENSGDIAPELIKLGTDSDLFSATPEKVIVAPDGSTEDLPIPDHTHYHETFGKTTKKIGEAKKGQFAFSPGNWIASPYPGCIGPFWGIQTVPARKPFDKFVGQSVSFPAELAALPMRSGQLFVITSDPIPGAVFEPMGHLLFFGDPVVDQVRQGQLADCGLMAILADIAIREPAFIKGMIHDNGDGTVLVRLFDIEVIDHETWNFRPRIVKISKSTVVKDGNDLFAKSGKNGQGALWASLIEKAYVAAGYLATTNQITPPEYLSMANLEGANTDFIYGHVRGIRSTLSNIPSNTRRPLDFEHDRFYGTYKKETLLWFNKIKTKLEEGKCVILESGNKVSLQKVTGKGLSGGEPMAGGLVGDHAYTALRAFEDIDGRRYLRVRNPWGEYGRAYNWKAKTAASNEVELEISDGEFNLELNDAVTWFKKVLISD